MCSGERARGVTRIAWPEQRDLALSFQPAVIIADLSGVMQTLASLAHLNVKVLDILVDPYGGSLSAVCAVLLLSNHELRLRNCWRLQREQRNNRFPHVRPLAIKHAMLRIQGELLEVPASEAGVSASFEINISLCVCFNKFN